jgi:serine/threonine-protein kinase RsbW
VPFEYRFSPVAATVPLARHLLADWLEHVSVDAEDAADLVLAASELCANAVRFASGAPGALELRAWCDADSIVVEVEDDGPGMEWPLERGEPPDPEADEGRGLFIADAFTDELTARREGGRTVVRAVKKAVLPSE